MTCFCSFFHEYFFFISKNYFRFSVNWIFRYILQLINYYYDFIIIIKFEFKGKEIFVTFYEPNIYSHNSKSFAVIHIRCSLHTNTPNIRIGRKNNCWILNWVNKCWARQIAISKLQIIDREKYYVLIDVDGHWFFFSQHIFFLLSLRQNVDKSNRRWRKWKRKKKKIKHTYWKLKMI